MSKEDLLSIVGVPYSFLVQDIQVQKPKEQEPSIQTDLQQELCSRVDKVLIINIYLLNGECIKLGAGSKDMLKVSDIINISDTFLTIKYDSHETNILYTSILKIEYFYKEVN